MVWTIEFDPGALDRLRQLDRSIQVRIFRFLEERVAEAEDPRRIGKPLKGRLGGYW